MTRDDLLRSAAAHLGLQELDEQTWDFLNKQLNTAKRRKVVGRDGEDVQLLTPSFKNYEEDFLIQTTKSVMRKNRRYDRPAVMENVATRLGYPKAGKTIHHRTKALLSSMIRKGIIESEGKSIWRSK